MKKIKCNIIQLLSISILLVMLLLVASPAFSYDYVLIWKIDLQDWLVGAATQTVNIKITNQPGTLTYTNDNITMQSNVDPYIFTVPNEGSYKVEAKTSHWLNKAEILDTYPVGVSINSGAEYTNTNNSVDLSLEGLNYYSRTVSQMMIKNEGGTWGSWVTFDSPITWDLTSGDGTKIVYVKFKYSNDDESGEYSDTIIRDTTAPNPGTATCNGYSDTSPITINYAGASDTGGSYLKKVELRYKKGLNVAWVNGSYSTPVNGSGSFSFTPTEWGTYYFDLVAEDNAGNRSAEPDLYSTGDCSTIYTYGEVSCSFSSIITPPAPPSP